MKRLIRRSAFAAIGFLAMVSAAGAQSNNDHDGDDCEANIVEGEGEFVIDYDVCGTGYAARYSSIRLISVVQQVVGRSFGFGPATMQPAGLSGLIADDAQQRLTPSTFIITPTADDAATDPALARRLNIWADTRGLYTDYDRSAGNLDGPTISLMAGADYKVNSKFTVGMLVSSESTSLENAINNLDSQSIGAGPYMGVVLTDNIVFSASVVGTRIDSDQAGGLLNFDTNRVQAAAALNGYWYKDTWRFSPALSLSWSKDWEEEQNGFVGDRTIAIGLLTPSLQIGKTVQLSDTVTMEPWAGPALDWTFDNTTHTDLLGTISYSDVDLRLLAGVNFGLPGSAQLTITGEVGGLLLEELNSYSIDANLAVQF